jgi:4-hydroxy-2-oxoheptanedioate aldolase
MSTDPAMTALYGVAGYDFVIIDQEHGPNDAASTIGHIRAADANGVLPLVRVLENRPTLIQKNLDLGAQGVVVPKVSTASEARRAVEASQYAPGGRGACSSVEGARWTGHWDDYAARANAGVVVIPLIETAEAVENFADIVGVDGVDWVIIGFADLAQDLGLDEKSAPARLSEIWSKCLGVAHENGVRIGCGVGTDFDRRPDFATISCDLRSLLRTLHKQRDEVTKTLTQPGGA